MRFWPRGVRKDRFDDWYQHLAPSPRLLGKFRETIADKALPKEERDKSWEQFVAAYRSEMSEQRTAIDGLRRRHESGETLTLLCACHDPARCHRTVLADLVPHVLFELDPAIPPATTKPSARWRDAT